MQNESSGTNTVLLVIILLLLVGFGVWWMTSRSKTAPEEQPPRNDGQLNIDISGSMQGNDSGSEGSNPNNP